MPYGYNGKILHVNLTTRSWEVEEPDEQFYRTYWGGGVLASYYLLKDVKPETDPLGEDNVLVFALSVLTGAPLSGFSRYTVSAKSPLTGGFAESEAGGYFGPELKFAGYDAVVIKGKADKPVYLWIKDGNVEIRDAGHLWGMENAEVMDTIRDEMDDKKIRIASIGQAGENLSPIACVSNNLVHFNGRCGMGAVMGSKNLKCIAARGEASSIEYADPEGLKAVAKWHRKAISEHMPNVNLGKNGTPMHVMTLQGQGILPTRNWQEGVFEGAENIGLPGYNEILTGRGTCYRCSVACKRDVEIDSKWDYDKRYGGPEFETLGAVGSQCGVSDLGAVVKMHERCGAYGFDTVSAGQTIAWAMELFERGILTADDCDGRVVKFGDGEGMLWLLEQMKEGKGLGKILALGSSKASKVIGRGSEEFVCTVKGQEPGTHDPRNKNSLALAFAVSPTGADHIECPHEVAFQGDAVKLIKPLGLLESPTINTLEPAKIRFFKIGQLSWGMNNMIGVCNYVVAPIFALSYSKLVEAIRVITGWETSLYELMNATERGFNMHRVFNNRMGWGREDDKVFKRLHNALAEGAAAGHKIEEKAFNEAIDLYYDMMGWDENGVPRKGKLAELGLYWLMED